MVAKVKAPSLTISAEIKKRARDFAERATSETYNRFTYNWNQRVEKVYVGKVGEEVLREYFLGVGLPAAEIDYNIYPGTSSIDETDLRVGPFLVDVKVGTQTFHKRLLVVKQYFDNKHQSDFYVALNLYDAETNAIIYGFADRAEIAKAPTGAFDRINPVPDYYLFYDNLRPIEELAKILRQKLLFPKD